MNKNLLHKFILEGIPNKLPDHPGYDASLNHAPLRQKILTGEERKLALKNSLRYFNSSLHSLLIPEFIEEFDRYGRIYMQRFRPHFDLSAGKISDYPCKSVQAAAIMFMINNNLDKAVAQHPHELITYGGNGAVFQNWAQYRLTMKYLAEMNDEQTLVLYSGHPLGLFPSGKFAPRAVITNGMMIPNYSSRELYEKFNALGVTQYGQMTAGSYMYIGPQGIVHGTTITLLNAGRKLEKSRSGTLAGKIFVTSGLGGMSGAQPKATVIAGGICLVAEINPKAVDVRFTQGWVDEVYFDIDKLIARAKIARLNREAVSIAYQGNVIDLLEKIDETGLPIELGSDQTSLHNPYSGGYYPAGLSFEEANAMMQNNQEGFKTKVQESLRRHVNVVNRLVNKGMYFWDYGNAFLLEAGRAGADVFNNKGEYIYKSYIQDIVGPMFFDYGFGPFRWVCTSNNPDDLAVTDKIAGDIIEQLLVDSHDDIKMQLEDNLLWIREAANNHLVVGSQARILYADSLGRIKIAEAFNKAIRDGIISAPVVLGRDHHDVSGTDSPYRETSNIYDGSSFTADMAIHNVIGDSFRGATWVSIHNGGGVGWGESVNGGFGLLIDGSDMAEEKLKMMLHWDVNNGIARRSWARNDGAMATIKREMNRTPLLDIFLPNIVDQQLIDKLTH